MQFYFQSECDPNINSSAPKKPIVVNYVDAAARERIRQLCLRKARQIQNLNLDPEANEYDHLEGGGEWALEMERGGAEERLRKKKRTILFS